MVKWRDFDRWARRRGYTFSRQGTNDEVIEGVDYANGNHGDPIATGRHNNRDGVPDRLLQEIAFRLGMTKHQLEQEI